MSINIYFASCQPRFKQHCIDIGGNALFSYVNDQSNIREWVADKEAGKCDNTKLFLDSGAYSAHTKGIEIDVDKYIEFINDKSKYFTCIAQVDKIPGVFRQPKTPQQLAEAPILSWENYNYMRERINEKDKLLPIFHQGEDFKHLKTILEARFNGSPVYYMGISPANDAAINEKKLWLDKVFEIISKSSNKNVCTHAFGFTSFKHLEQYPFTSADSTSWILTAGYGNIMLDGKTWTISSKSASSPSYWTNAPIEVQQRILEVAEQRGVTVEQLQEEYFLRATWNMSEVKDKADAYVCKYKPTRQRKLF